MQSVKGKKGFQKVPKAVQKKNRHAVLLNDSDSKRLRAMAKKKGLSVSEYIRFKIFAE